MQESRRLLSLHGRFCFLVLAVAVRFAILSSNRHKVGGIVNNSLCYFGSLAKACGLGIDSSKSKQEEISVYDASELRSELFDFSIERFRRSIGRTVNKIV